MNERLLAAGFNEFDPPSYMHADRFWQKRYRDANGDTRYFLDVFKYGDKFEIEINYGEGATCWNGKAIWIKTEVAADETAEEIERFGRELWDRLTPNYYERI